MSGCEQCWRVGLQINGEQTQIVRMARRASATKSPSRIAHLLDEIAACKERVARYRAVVAQHERSHEVLP